MKKLYTIIVLFAFATGIYAQELDSLKRIMGKEDTPDEVIIEDDDGFTPLIIDDDEEEVTIRVLDKEVVKVIEDGDTTVVKLGEKGVIKVADHRDSTSIKVGDKEIRIVKRDEDQDPEINIYELDEDKKIRNKKFRGHWAGIGWGLNNFLDDDMTISREGDDVFMDLNTGRSWAIDLNIAQYSLGFGTTHAGLVTGLGLEYNNYFFDRNNSIVEVDDMVVVDSLFGDVGKSKLTTLFLRVPLLFEVQFPNTVRAKRVFISAGIVGGLKLASHTKVVFKEENGKNKDKNNDDFNINPFRWGVTACVGYGTAYLFADYYMTPMFVADKGPDLHPFTIGLAMTF
ncbi:MAG: outer membrane beta-barrel protein [Bacteroidales bacterium]|nr:outer membrane beta-barrel protein [Bacteroidales bacterium]